MGSDGLRSICGPVRFSDCRVPGGVYRSNSPRRGRRVPSISLEVEGWTFQQGLPSGDRPLGLLVPSLAALRPVCPAREPGAGLAGLDRLRDSVFGLAAGADSRRVRLRRAGFRILQSERYRTGVCAISASLVQHRGAGLVDGHGCLGVQGTFFLGHERKTDGALRSVHGRLPSVLLLLFANKAGGLGACRGAVMKNFLFAIAVCALALLAGAACGSEERVDLRDALYQSVSTGSIFTCAVSTEGYLRCWGRNEGHEESGFTEAPGGTYRIVSSGYYGSCALKTDGQLKCWGRVDGKKPSDRFATIDVATDDVCGIRLDGSLHCWGRDLSGLSGYPEGTYTALSAGGGTACAMRSDGRPICWGGIEEWDYAGEIRNELSLGEFEAVSVGGLVLCGLRRGGEVDCWKGLTGFWIHTWILLMGHFAPLVWAG